MTRTTYPYLHGGNVGAVPDYEERPFGNWEKSANWYAATITGVAFDGKGFPQNNPTDYPTHTATLFLSEGTRAVLPIGNYYIKTDPSITLTGFQLTLTQSGLTAPQIASGLWKMTNATATGNIGVACYLGGGAGTGTPMTHFRVRTDTGAGVPASIYLDDVIWRQPYLDAHANIGCARFLGWMLTNDNFTYTGVAFVATAAPGSTDIATATLPTSWAGRVTKDCFNWCTQTLRGMPVEVMVDFCNRLGCDGWFPLHFYATTSFQTSFVQYVHDNLTPGLVAHFEHSNEVWNYVFGQTQFGNVSGKNKANASTPGYTAVGVDDNGNMLRDHSDRIKALALIVNAIYTDRPQDKRNVIAFQSASSNTGTVKAQFNNTQAVCDVYSPAPYFYTTFDPTVDANWAALGDGVRGSAAWYAALATNVRAGIDATFVNVKTHTAYAHANGMELACYEGGQHLLNNTYTPELQTFAASQALGDAYSYYIGLLRTIPGIMINWFTITNEWSGSGTWGLKQLTSDADTPKYTAVMSDAANRAVQPVTRGSRKATSF
jgi:hypothetical protein